MESNQPLLVRARQQGISKKLFRLFKETAWVDASALYDGKGPEYPAKPKTTARQKPKRDFKIVKDIPREYVEKLKRRRYSENTINTYASLFTDFVNYYAQLEPERITEDDIRRYQDYLVNKRKVSYSTQNQAIKPVGFLHKPKYYVLLHVCSFKHEGRGVLYRLY